MDASKKQAEADWTPEQQKSENRWVVGESIGLLAMVVALALAMGGAFGESESHGGPLGLWSDCGKGGHRDALVLRDLDLGHAAWCAVGSLMESSGSSSDDIGLRFDYFDKRH